MNHAEAKVECGIQVDADSMLQQSIVISAMHHQRADEQLPEIRGFVRSPFNPLVYHSVQQAVLAAGMQHGSWPDSSRIGIVLGSMFIDAVTEEESWRDLLQGKKLSPIMFPQSVPSAIIGLLARDLSIHGPMSCISASQDSWSIMLDMAQAWIADDYADIVVLTVCEVPSLRSEAWEEEQGISHDWSGGVWTLIVEKPDQAVQRGLLDRAVTFQQFRDRYVDTSSPCCGMLGSILGRNTR